MYELSSMYLSMYELLSMYVCMYVSMSYVWVFKHVFNIYLGMYELLLPPDLKALKMIWNIPLIFAYHSKKSFVNRNSLEIINIHFVNRNSLEIKVTIVFPIAKCQRWIQEPCCISDGPPFSSN